MLVAMFSSELNPNISMLSGTNLQQNIYFSRFIKLLSVFKALLNTLTPILPIVQYTYNIKYNLIT